MVLAVEIPTTRQTADSRKASSTHSDHGPGQSDLGASPHRSGAPLEAGNSGVSLDRSEVSVGASKGWPTPDGSIPALDDLCPQSCQRDRGLRLFRLGFRPLSNHLCAGHHGGRNTATGPLRKMVKDWQIHYNQGRPHSSLGPGLSEPRPGLPVPLQEQRHQIPTGYQVRAKPILGGLQHEYQLEKIAA
jgi:hypothetical protein